MPCCSHAVHIECQIKWELTSTNGCGYCRQIVPTNLQTEYPELTTRLREALNIARANPPLLEPAYTPPREPMTREQIITRLEQLLGAENLEERLHTVSVEHLRQLCSNCEYDAFLHNQYYLRTGFGRSTTVCSAFFRGSFFS